MDPNQKPIRIDCYSAFYGDSPEAAVQLVKHEESNLNYLDADYLACKMAISKFMQYVNKKIVTSPFIEITMGIFSIRRKQRRMMQHMGPKDDGSKEYVVQFPHYVPKRILPDVIQNETRIVTNADMLKETNLSVKVVAATGDDLLEPFDKDRPLATVFLEQFKNCTSSSLLSATKHKLHAEKMSAEDEPIVSLHAYLGARGIAAAVNPGAQIVVVDRVVDSALVMVPLMYEFGWHNRDTNGRYYDNLLASASLADHITKHGSHT